LSVVIAAGGDVVILHRPRRDHRFVAQPQLVDIVFGIVAEPRDIARLGEAQPHRRDCGIVAVQLDLIEPVIAPLDDEEIGEAVHAGHVEMLRGADPLGPFAGIVDAGGHQPELRIHVVGVDEQGVVMLVDIIFAAGLARGYAAQRCRRVVGRQQIDFAGHVIAGRDHQPFARARLADRDREAFIGLLEELDVVGGPACPACAARIVGAPILVGTP
jgi:hypothetical protein